MVKIILEDWQVKNLREYFGHNDKTQTSHWAYEVFNKAYKEQCNIPDVSNRRELYFAFMEEYNALMGESEHQILKEEVEVLLAKYSC